MTTSNFVETLFKNILYNHSKVTFFHISKFISESLSWSYIHFSSMYSCSKRIWTSFLKPKSRESQYFKNSKSQAGLALRYLPRSPRIITCARSIIKRAVRACVTEVSICIVYIWLCICIHVCAKVARAISRRRRRARPTRSASATTTAAWCTTRPTRSRATVSPRYNPGWVFAHWRLPPREGYYALLLSFRSRFLFVAFSIIASGASISCPARCFDSPI